MSIGKKLYNLFPVNKEEYKLFFAISLNFILTLYIYSILRNTKDVLVIKVEAELISALKLWFVLPSAVLIMMAYTKLADYFNRLQLYYILIGFFAGYFLLFMFVLVPNIDSLQTSFAEAKIAMPFFKYVFSALENWVFSSFYIMSELWGSVMLSLMFWQLANQIVSIDQAKRFYPFFAKELPTRITFFNPKKLMNLLMYLAKYLTFVSISEELYIGSSGIKTW